VHVDDKKIEGEKMIFKKKILRKEQRKYSRQRILRREHEIKLSSKNIALCEASVSRCGRGSDRRSGGVGGGRGG
jgi:hypothetical protein